ncbi:hypothetical protein F5Y03DRAFT_407141 [Xylaria venustula]|nr:hypothetical protein F5Y03DRAFT_407141 [Xylaria venustula]
MQTNGKLLGSPKRSRQQARRTSPRHTRLPGRGALGTRRIWIALEYAYSRKDRDPRCSVFWVHADSDTSFTQDYNLIARELGLSKDLSGNDLQAVCDKLVASPNWVLVLDNADDLTWFGVMQEKPSRPNAGFNLYSFIPKFSTGTGTGTVLWTSRDKQIGGLVGAKKAIEVVAMTTEEAKELLGTTRTEGNIEDEDDTVGELLAELGYLPLAVSQAAAYMRRTSTSVKDYLFDIRIRKDMRWRVLGRSEFDQHRRDQGSNSVLETWDISVEYLRKENELTYDVLHSLAFIDNQNIPLEFIEEAALISNQNRHNQIRNLKSSIVKQLVFPFRSIIRRPHQETNGFSHSNNQNSTSNYDIKEITSRLCQFSFLTARSSSPGGWVAYDMHKLVQEAARYRLQNGEDEVKGETCFAKTAFQITDRLFPKPEGRGVEAWGQEVWGRCEQCLPHALHAGKWAELHRGEVTVAALFGRLSWYLYAQARWTEKEAVDEKRYYFLRKALGDRHKDTLDAMYKEAEELYQKTIQLQEAVLGKIHPSTLLTMNNLAQVKGRILEQRKQILGEKHPDTLFSMDTLGEVINRQERYKDAEDIFGQVLQLRTEVLGEKHPDTLHTLNKLGITINYQGRHKEAERIYRQVLQLGTEVMNNLGTAVDAQKRHEEAEHIQRQVLKLRTEVLGERHPDAVYSMESLGIAIGLQGRHEEAERLIRKALGLQLEVLGRKHFYTLGNTKSLSWILRKQGKDEEAEQLAMDFEADRPSVIFDGAKEPPPPPPPPLAVTLI